MNDNSIRVRILAADAATIHIVPVDDIRECRRCAEGNGCGSRPWFRGFFRHGSIVLPNRDGWRAGETAELHLSAAGLNYSALLTYGLPPFSSRLSPHKRSPNRCNCSSPAPRWPPLSSPRARYVTPLSAAICVCNAAMRAQTW